MDRNRGGKNRGQIEAVLAEVIFWLSSREGE